MYGNFKVKCLDARGCSGYTNGKIYEVVDGVFTYDGGNNIIGIDSFDEFNNMTSAIWEIVEDSSDLRELIKPCYVVVRREGSVCGIFETNKGMRLQMSLGSSMCFLEEYDENLTKKEFKVKDGTDIMEVYGLSTYSFDISINNRPLIWKREETPIKSPTQLKLEELEKKQREIADEMEKLRKEL